MSLLKDIWNAVSGVGKGMQKTYDEQFDPVFTNMYPFVQPDLPPVSVQSLALILNEDGSDRCVSCLACEKVCPSQVITIERKRNPAGKGFVLERFDLDLVNCMYCAACVEACPAQAIVTIQDFELSTPNLQSLKADKAFLDAQGLRARQWYSPKVGVEYREEDPNNPVHGRIVKAPIEEQPGGFQEMEKARLAALNPAPVAEKPAPTTEAAPTAKAPQSAPSTLAPASAKPSSAEPSSTVPATPAIEGEAPKNPKIKRFEPKTPMASSAAPVAPTEPQGMASSVPAEAPKAEAPKAAPVEVLRPQTEAPKAETPPQTVSGEAKSTVRDVPVAAVASREPVEAPKPETPKVEAKPAEAPAPKAEAPVTTTPDDLTVIEGIGPKRAEALNAAGVTTFVQLSQSDKTKLESIMSGAGLSLEPGIETWPLQAEFLVKGDQAGFKAFTDKLVAGRVKDSKPKNPKVKRWEPKS
jgi:formate hydrogenlyase subunit 6/NADH:ubiquinone oxidoreductase subunit I/predicted flap endonuclease-1-like 5' DNA nuclease